MGGGGGTKGRATIRYRHGPMFTGGAFKAAGIGGTDALARDTMARNGDERPDGAGRRLCAQTVIR